ncbi:MAG: VOC family protein [Actinoplanes sp.]
MTADSARPTRTEASAAVSALGWRYILGTLQATVRLASLHQAAEITARLVHECGTAADDSLSIDLRPGLLLLTLRSRRAAAVTQQDLDLARLLDTTLREFGLHLEPAAGRSVQALEIAIDALDIPAIRPFWAAILAYGPETPSAAPATVTPDKPAQPDATPPGPPGPPGPLVDPAASAVPLVDPAASAGPLVDAAASAGPLVDAAASAAPLFDPVGQGPVVWFQQMASPRPGRNRIHLDISVPHDEAPHRLRAALAAGGTLVSAERAPAFWVLADPEGNEACITTWQGRD